MAQTFTGKMFSMRNNSLKNQQNSAQVPLAHGNYASGEKSHSVHARNSGNINIQNYSTS